MCAGTELFTWDYSRDLLLRREAFLGPDHHSALEPLDLVALAFQETGRRQDLLSRMIDHDDLPVLGDFVDPAGYEFQGYPDAVLDGTHGVQVFVPDVQDTDIGKSFFQLRGADGGNIDMPERGGAFERIPFLDPCGYSVDEHRNVGVALLGRQTGGFLGQHSGRPQAVSDDQGVFVLRELIGALHGVQGDVDRARNMAFVEFEVAERIEQKELLSRVHFRLQVFRGDCWKSFLRMSGR